MGNTASYTSLKALGFLLPRRPPPRRATTLSSPQALLPAAPTVGYVLNETWFSFRLVRLGYRLKGTLNISPNQRFLIWTTYIQLLSIFY